MVKRLDEKNELLDHVGWRLWRANEQWVAEFADAMRAAGHDWFSESRANLLGHLPQSGLRQSALIARMAISKQAVQQLLDGLESEAVLIREQDPDDLRGKFVRYTPKGLAALGDGDRIKQEIEAAYRRRIGNERFDALMDALRALQR